MKIPTMMLALCLGGCGAAWAQTPGPAPPEKLPRWDAGAHLDWFNVRKEQAVSFGADWYHVVAGGGSLGFYWTPHLKTEIDVTTAGEGRVYAPQQVFRPDVSGFPAYRFGERHYRQTTLSVGQQYQFFRNQWVHPFVAAGLDLQWERSRGRFDPITRYQVVNGVSRTVVLEPAFTEGPKTTLRARPFVAVGFKAYFTERAFFRSEMKFVPIDDRQTSWRVGVGVDF